MSDQTTPEWLTTAEAAGRMGISVDEVRAMCREGMVDALRDDSDETWLVHKCLNPPGFSA